jgi:hypothetical protein
MHWEWFMWAHDIYGGLDGFTCSWNGNAIGSHNIHGDNTVQSGSGTCASSCCVYKAKGKYTGIGGESSSVKIDHHPAKGESYTTTKQMSGKAKNTP